MSSRIPSLYVELDYVKTTSNSRINTELYANFMNTKIEIDIEAEPFCGGDPEPILSVAYSTINKVNYMLYAKRTGESEITFRSGNSDRQTLEKNITASRLIISFDYWYSKFSAGDASSTIGKYNITMTNPIYLFNLPGGANSIPCKCYGVKIRDWDLGVTLNFVPCKTQSGLVGFYDLASQRFFPGEPGAFIAGPEKDADPHKNHGIGRRELWVDAKDLQSEKEDGQAMTVSEYSLVLANRGAEKLANSQLVRSFDASVRSHNPTYEYGKDFFLGDTITVADDRLGVSVDAVVQGAQKAVSREGESLSFVFGYEQPTLIERIRRG